MNGSVLVAYGSWCGSAAEVAEEIGKVLQAAGARVEVMPADRVGDVSAYSAAVIGTAIRAGRCKGEVTKFVKRHEEALRRMPMAVFSVGLQMQEDTEENRDKAIQFLKPITDCTQPVGVGLFGGAVDASKASFPWSLVMGRLPQGDWRNWDTIRDWAQGLAESFSDVETGSA